MNRIIVQVFFLFCLSFSKSIFAQEGTPEKNSYSQGISEAHALADHGKIDQAIEKLKELLIEIQKEKINPLRLKYDLANLLFLQGRYQEAEVVYREVVKMAEEENELLQRSQARVHRMQERETKKTDQMAIKLIEIETALNQEERPAAGSREYLQKVPLESLHYERAGSLLSRLQLLENKMAGQMLNEARQIFDSRKDYPKVIEILKSIEQEFPGTDEMSSVRILRQETEKKLKRKLF